MTFDLGNGPMVFWTAWTVHATLTAFVRISNQTNLQQPLFIALGSWHISRSFLYILDQAYLSVEEVKHCFCIDGALAPTIQPPAY